jgi:hypothetical protein
MYPEHESALFFGACAVQGGFDAYVGASASANLFGFTDRRHSGNCCWPGGATVGPAAARATWRRLQCRERPVDRL